MQLEVVPTLNCDCELDMNVAKLICGICLYYALKATGVYAAELTLLH